MALSITDVQLPTKTLDNTAFGDLASIYLNYLSDVALANENIYVPFDAPVPFTVSLQDVLQTHTNLKLSGVQLGNLEICDTVYSNNRTESEVYICWINKDDPTVYQATCHVGSFDMTGMIAEVLRAMSAVPRSNGTLHQWYSSTPSAPANAVAFYNVQFSALPADPISTVSNSSVVTITAPQHGLRVNDFVTFQNVINNPGAIEDDAFNNVSFTVNTVIDADHFTVTVSGIAYTTSGPTEDAPTGYGGGANVQLGVGVYYSFVRPSPPLGTDGGSSNDDKSALELMGFPPESGLNVAVQYGLTAQSFATAFAKGNATTGLKLPTTLIKDYSIVDGQSISVSGLTRLGLPAQYTVTSGYLTVAQANYDAADAKEMARRLNDMSSQDQKRVYFVSSAFAMSRMQTNVFDTGTLYQGVNLSGDTYCYLVEQNTQKKLAKVQLRAGNGFIDFNTYSYFPLTSRDLSQIQRVGSFDCALRTSNNKVLYYQNLKISGTFVLSFAPPSKPVILQGMTSQ